MAADLASLTVSIDGSAAVQNANQVAAAVTNMGNAGDAAGQKIGKMSQPMKQATSDANAVKGGMDNMGKSMETASGHSAKLGQQMMYAERAIHDLLTTFGLGGGPANVVGRFFRGIEDGVIALQKGGAAMAGFMISMAAFSGAMAAMAAVVGLFKSAIDQIQEAMKSAAESEKFGIMLKDVIGSSKDAQAQLNQLKEFVKGEGAHFQLQDVVLGVRHLELLTHTSSVSQEQLQRLSIAAELNRQTFDHVATQYGRVVEAIQTGNPVRAQLLTQMVAEGLITQATQARLETLAKAHASAAEQIRTLDEGMNASQSIANDLAGSYDHVVERLQRVFDIDIKEPLGQGFIGALEPMLTELANFVDQPGIRGGIERFSHEMGVDMLTVFLMIKDKGFGQVLKEGWDTLVEYMNKTWQNTPMGKRANELLGTIPGSGVTPTPSTAENPFIRQLQDFINSNPGTKLLAEMGKDDYNLFMWWWNQFVKGPQVVAWLQSLFPKSPTPSQPPSAYGAALQQAGQYSGRATPLNEDNMKELGDQLIDNVQKAKDLSDKTNALGEKTTSLTTSTGFLDATNKTLINAVTNLIAKIQGLQLPYGAGGQYPVVSSPPFPGATQGLSEWAPGEPIRPGAGNQTDIYGNQLRAGVGPLNYGGDIALSLDKMRELFGSELLAYGKFVDILDKSGNIILEHQRVADVSFKSEGHPNVNTFEVYGRRFDAWGQVVAGGTKAPTQAQTDWEKYHAQAESMMPDQKASADAASKVAGAIEKFEKPAKEQKQDLKDIKDLVSDLTTEYGLYEKKLQDIDKEYKNGQITITQANALKLQAAKAEEAELQKGIALLKQQEAEVKKAHPTQDLTEYDNKVKILNEDLQRVQATEKELAGTDPWTAFLDGVRQAVNSVGDMQTQITTIGKDITEKFADGFAGMFTSITDGSKTAKQAFLDFAKSFLDSIEQMILKMIVMDAIGKVLGMFGGTSGAGAAQVGQLALSSAATIAHGQTGGLVYGPSGVDRVPSLLTAGEYVMRKSAVDRLGVGYLAALNHFASGGFVGAGSGYNNIPPSSNPSGQLVGNVTVASTINIGGAERPRGQQQGASGMSKEDLTDFQNQINAVVKAEIVKQKRPGGLLNKHSY